MVNEMRVILGRRALSITSARLLVIFQKLKALMRVDWRVALFFLSFFVAVRWESMETAHVVTVAARLVFH